MDKRDYHITDKYETILGGFLKNEIIDKIINLITSIYIN